jgi:hypothetical protein
MNVTNLMNAYTGSVDTKENWRFDMINWGTSGDGKTPEQQFADLVEVADDGEGGWVAVSDCDTANVMRINSVGLEEIKIALKKYMREDAHSQLNDSAPRIYASEIEENWVDGNGVGFDIDARLTVSGRPVLVQISDAGFEIYKHVA